ncbi:unnamed protein product [Owenia fusiformis]|uniref:Mitochondrial ribonuclease P catalytic subunit n=1 Tax=Owenia fusiformis TaxID=6347 RepID=A0A8J1Y5K2_OWEFU|nr:unnamed protein product [Owenia fusiformis]
MYCWGFMQRFAQRLTRPSLGGYSSLSGVGGFSLSNSRPYIATTHHCQMIVPNINKSQNSIMLSLNVNMMSENVNMMSKNVNMISQTNRMLMIHSNETNVKRESKKPLWEKAMQELRLEKDHLKSVDDWEDFKSSMVDQVDNERQRERLENTWYVSVMRALGRYGKYQLAQSLVKYVRHKDLNESILFMTSFMLACTSSKSPDAEQQVLNIYNKILEKTEHFDNSTGADVVHALCKTSLWENSFSIIEKLDTHGPTHQKLYSHVLSAALCNKNAKRTSEVLDNFTKFNSQPYDFVYTDVIRGLDTEDGKRAIYTLLNKSRQNSWVLSMNAAMKLKDFFEGLQDEKWSGSLTTVNVKGECTRCHKIMDQLELAPDYFNTLHKAFVESSLIENVFLKTTPEEMTVFKKFVEKNGPFDIVIDGLNILHQTIKSKHTNKKFLKEQQQKAFDFLEDVIEKLNDDGRKKVLVITRKHVKHWNIQRVRSINKIVDMFFTQDLSEDDCFMLYAALYSGPNCRLCSNDELTDHKFVMPEELREAFMLWQRSHQVMVTVGKGRGQPLINDLQKYDIRVTMDEHKGRVVSIHVPYDDLQDRVSYKRPNSWLCLSSMS